VPHTEGWRRLLDGRIWDPVLRSAGGWERRWPSGARGMSTMTWLPSCGRSWSTNATIGIRPGAPSWSATVCQPG